MRMCNGDYFSMYPLFNFEPVEEFKRGNNMGMFTGAGDSVDKCISNLLKAFNLRERKPVVKIITIIKTKVNKGSSDSSGGG